MVAETLIADVTLVAETLAKSLAAQLANQHLLRLQTADAVECHTAQLQWQHQWSTTQHQSK